MRSGSNIANNCGGALITESLGGGTDEFGYYYYYYYYCCCYYYYYYYISTADSAVILCDLNISECMIMICLEINGPITVFKVLWV